MLVYSLSQARRSNLGLYLPQLVHVNCFFQPSLSSDKVPITLKISKLITAMNPPFLHIRVVCFIPTIFSSLYFLGYDIF